VSDQITCCPNCDSSEISVVGVGSDLSQRDIPAYNCEACDHRFDEPSTRPRKATNGLMGIARVLDKADPDEPLVDVARRAVGKREGSR